MRKHLSGKKKNPSIDGRMTVLLLEPVSFSGIERDLKIEMWGFSSAGRAPALQAGGQRFDPANLHHMD